MNPSHRRPPVLALPFLLIASVAFAAPVDPPAPPADAAAHAADAARRDAAARETGTAPTDNAAARRADHARGAALDAQRTALAALARLDGEWRGTASITLPSGQRHTMTQTERVGPMLDGTVRVIEGRGYAPDGALAFNAFAVVSYDPARQAYTMRSYAQGSAGDFPFRATVDGFEWEIPSGTTTTRYRATVRDGRWTQTGERIAAGQAPVPFFEMTLTRVGDSDWPAGGAVSME